MRGTRLAHAYGDAWGRTGREIENIEIKDFLNDIEAYDIIITNNNVAFKYDGNINSLLTKLNKIKLNSLKIYPQDIYQLGV